MAGGCGPGSDGGQGKLGSQKQVKCDNFAPGATITTMVIYLFFSPLPHFSITGMNIARTTLGSPDD